MIWGSAKVDFSAQKLVWRAELSLTTKLTSGDETPPIANVVLVADKSFSCNLSTYLNILGF
jgi:hypothetical protein